MLLTEAERDDYGRACSEGKVVAVRMDRGLSKAAKRESGVTSGKKGNRALRSRAALARRL